MKLDVEQGEAGLWYVTSPEVKGLLVAGGTMSEALASVPAAMREMISADTSAICGGLKIGDDRR